MPRFLIDECCTTSLAAAAKARGFESSHVAHIGLAGWRDENLMPVVLAGDWTFVTNNRRDWLKLHAATCIHAGLIVIVPSVGLEQQLVLFEAVLDWLDASRTDLVNLLIEIDCNARISAREWALPDPQ